MTASAASGWAALCAAAQAMGAEAPAAVARGLAALEATLAPLERSAWPEVAWSFSDLAPGGFPAELVWRPSRPGLFWTAEPSPPETPPARRLDAALARLAALGAPMPPSGVLSILGRAAAASRGQSIWLGGRHDAEGDRYKLYAGVAEGAADVVPGQREWRPLSTEGWRLFHVGADPGGGIELYWRLRHYRPGDLAAMGRNAGLPDTAARIRQGLAELCGRDPEAALEGRRMALSLLFDPIGNPTALAFYSALPSQAFGGARVQQWLAMLAEQNGSMAPGALWRRGVLAPSWLGATAAANQLDWHAGLVLPRVTVLNSEAPGLGDPVQR